MSEPPALIHGLPSDAGPLLDLLSKSWPEPERSLQRQVLQSALAECARQGFVCVRACRHDELLGVVLAQQLPGRTAAVYPPQWTSAAPANMGGHLLLALESSLQSSGVELAQSLLALDQTDDEAQLHAAGFVTAATLLYMACESRCAPTQPPRIDLTFEPVSPASEPRLREVLEATYEGTLDCPLLNGLRSTEDVLAGYRAVGTHRAAWWLLVRRHTEDVGCLILADHPEAGNAEIVYLGIAPAARGHQLGEVLVNHAKYLAAEQERDRVVLAVDAANHPAIGMYEAAGFFGFDQRLVMIKKLGANTTTG